jgi:uncharacterized damage-inducible protein DinB
MKSFIRSISLALLSASIAAQPASDGGYTGTIRASWMRVQRLVAASAELMPETEYAFKPSKDVRSFGELIGHLANEHYLLCSGLKGEQNPKKDTDFEKTATKAGLIQALKESNAYCDAAYGAAKDDPKLTQPIAQNRRDTPFGVMLLNVTHDSEHYGNLVTYLRMKGLVPPSSRPTR